MKVAIEKVWEQVGVDHKAVITAYDTQCVVLLAKGVAKNWLSKKPKKGIKPKEVELSESKPETEGSNDDSNVSHVPRFCDIWTFQLFYYVFYSVLRITSHNFYTIH